jgi:hypothetical protein
MTKSQFGMLMLTLAFVGCSSVTHEGSAADAKMDSSSVVIDVPAGSDGGTIRLLQVDGRDGPHVSKGFSLTGPTYVTGKIYLRPGLHSLEVSYDDGSKYSLANCELKFTGQAGHTYQIRDWPPQIIDATTGERVAQQARMIPRN